MKASAAGWYDAHNHLQDTWLAPHRDAVLATLRHLPLRGAVVNGTCPADWPDVAALTAGDPMLRPSYGLHPWHVGQAPPDWRDQLRARLESDPSAAVGEIGLDGWILDRARPDDPRLAGLVRASLEVQREAFVWQLQLAASLRRPVTIHCLDAWGPLLDVLRTTALPPGGFLLHAYSGSTELARELVQLGAYFSFNGSFLAERYAARRSVFAELPLDRLLAETDAPAMPLPAARRRYSLPDQPDGTTVNHPANIGEVYRGLAAFRGMPPEALESQLAGNFRRLFGGR